LLFDHLLAHSGVGDPVREQVDHMTICIDVGDIIGVRAHIQFSQICVEQEESLPGALVHFPDLGSS
jgi:hypothetical protein